MDDVWKRNRSAWTCLVVVLSKNRAWRWIVIGRWVRSEAIALDPIRDGDRAEV